MSNQNLYQNKFINTRDEKFESNEERFKNFMSQKNNDVLKQQRLPNPNLKTELVIPKKQQNIKKQQKIRSTVISVNSKNRTTFNNNVTFKNKKLSSNKLTLVSGSKELVFNLKNHQLKTGSEIELQNVTNEYTSSNIFTFQGGSISSCASGFNGVINTSTAHGLSVNSNVLISKTNVYPSINKEVQVKSIPSSTQFTINSPINLVNTGTGIWGSKELSINLSNHGLNTNSNVTISGVEDDVTLSSDPLSLSLDGSDASLTVSYTNHPFIVGEKITIKNATKEISLGNQPIFLKLPDSGQTISNIEITTSDTTHKIQNSDSIALSGVKVNHLLTDNSLRTLGGQITNIVHTTGLVTITTATQHHLQVGNTVSFFDTKTVPTMIGSEHTITAIVDNTNFKISLTLREIISTKGTYGSKIINVLHSITNANNFITGKSINISGLDDNLISNGINNSYVVLNSTMTNTTDKFQVNAANAFPLTTPKVTELFGSNINIGSNFIDSSALALNTINKNYNVISGGGSTTLIVASDDIVSLSENFDIGGASGNSKIVCSIVLDKFDINHINSTYTITSKNTNDFTVNIGSTSATDSLVFGGSSVAINKLVGVPNTDLNITHLVKSITDTNNFKIDIGTFSNTDYTGVGGENLNLSLDTVGGIFLNNINSKQPLDTNHLQGSQLVTKIDENNFKIFLPQNSTIDRTFGGDNVITKEIKQLIRGYNNQNNYVLELDRKYENVQRIDLISTEFVNSEQIVKDSSFGTLQNNLVNLKVENDSTIYTKELIPGNYDSLSFSNMITSKLSEITTIDSLNLVFECEISADTGKLTLKNFVRQNLSKAFSVTQNSNIITVTHNSHGFENGDIIKILNSSNVDTIVSTDINNLEHTITVIDSNSYKFTVVSTALNNASNKGGKTIQILKPKKISLLFSQSNTSFSLFGFDNSDTIFATNLTGTNLVDLSGDDYFYMCSPQLSDTVKDDGQVRDIFAKILLNQAPGNILYDTYVSNPKVFYDTPLKFIDKIEFIFREPNNNLFFMNNLEHSFSLRIDEVIEIIENTNFSSRTGNFN
jgi:hypothetical protein